MLIEQKKKKKTPIYQRNSNYSITIELHISKALLFADMRANFGQKVISTVTGMFQPHVHQ